MPLNATQTALRWALTATGVHDHLADVLVNGYKPAQIIEAVAYARSINANSVAAVVVKSLTKGWRYPAPSLSDIRETIAFLGLETCEGITRLWPFGEQA